MSLKFVKNQLVEISVARSDTNTIMYQSMDANILRQKRLKFQ